MPSEIVETRPATPEEWDHAWERCAYATYFHSRAWAELWERYTKGRIRPAPLTVRFADGAAVILPTSRRRVAAGLASIVESSPAGTFGGWISADEVGPAHAQALAAMLVRSRHGLRWRLNPYDPHATALRPRGASNDSTRALDLTDGFEAVFHRWSKGHRAAVKQARREGLTVRLAQSADDWRSYGRVYDDSVRRWGAAASVVYSARLFELLHETASPHVRLWLAADGERVVAGAICLYARRHVVYWHGAALEDYFAKRPANLLVHAAIEDACQRGLRWFDFNPSGGHEGVEQFKSHFGAKRLDAPVVAVESGWFALAVGARRRLGSLVRAPRGPQ
jgi:hypothetical protein